MTSNGVMNRSGWVTRRSSARADLVPRESAIAWALTREMRLRAVSAIGEERQDEQDDEDRHRHPHLSRTHRSTEPRSVLSLTKVGRRRTTPVMFDEQVELLGPHRLAPRRPRRDRGRGRGARRGRRATPVRRRATRHATAPARGRRRDRSRRRRGGPERCPPTMSTAHRHRAGTRARRSVPACRGAAR